MLLVGLELRSHAGRHLDPQDVEVADEIPGRLPALIHPSETVAGGVVDCVG